MSASPALRELDREDNRRHAERFAVNLVSLDDKVDYEDAALSILVALERAPIAARWSPSSPECGSSPRHSPNANQESQSMRPFNSANWRFAPYNRNSFQDIQALFRTARTKRGEGPPTELPISTRDIRDVEFPGATGSTGTISQLLDAPESDAFLVLKDGVLLSEHYGNGMARDSLHLVNSVSKSLLGMLAGILCDEGVVDVDRPVTAYLPELNGIAFPRTTVRHLLDMTAAVQFGEDYDNQSDDFWVEAIDRRLATGARRPDVGEVAARLRSVEDTNAAGR